MRWRSAGDVAGVYIGMTNTPLDVRPDPRGGGVATRRAPARVGAVTAAPVKVVKSRADWMREASELKARIHERGERVSATMFARLARARRSVGDFAGAADALREGNERFVEHSHLLREAAELAATELRWAEAVDFFRRAILAEGDKAGVVLFTRLSAALQRLDKLAQARDAVLQGLRLHPEDLQLRNELFDVGWALQRSQAMRARSIVRGEISVERICNAFWEVERRLSLLDWRVGGVAPWPLVRMPLYYAATQRLAMFDPPHPALKGAAPEDMDALAFEAQWRAQEAHHASMIERRAPPKSARDAVIMATKKINGSEPYTDALRAELGDRALLLDFSVDGETMPGAHNFHRYKDLFRSRYRRPELSRLSKEAVAVCDGIWCHLFDELGVDVGNVAKTCRQRIVDFDAVYRGFDMFFGVNPIQTLYLTNGYGSTNRAVLQAARANGARVVELQHGFISAYHLGYSWPGRPEVPYTPDELWTFGSFWPETTPLPANMTWRVIGAPYVLGLAAAASGQPRDESLVVFTSQGVIGRRLFDMALETARRRPDRRVVFRLHPNENLSDYESLLRAAGGAPANFSLSHKSPNIFALLATAAIQVGAFSTTLFEGMSLGTRTIVVDMPGAEYMRPVVDKGDALFVRNVDELVARLDDAPLCLDSSVYYADPLPRLT